MFKVDINSQRDEKANFRQTSVCWKFWVIGIVIGVISQLELLLAFYLLEKGIVNRMNAEVGSCSKALSGGFVADYCLRTRDP